jgi:hypothetical protein
MNRRERNGQYRHGERTKAAIAEQRRFGALVKMLRDGLTYVERIGTNKQRIRPLLDKCCKDLIELVFACCIQDSELEAKCLRGGLRVPRLRLGNRTFRVHE